MVTFLNVLGEFGFRSFAKVVSSGLIFLLYLLITYFTFAIMCEYQIREKKLNYVGLFIFSFIMGVLWQLIFPITIFAAPRFLGINWFVFLFVDILMWSSIQAVLFFYLARRLFPRQSDKSGISKKVFLAALVTFCLITLIPHVLFKLHTYPALSVSVAQAPFKKENDKVYSGSWEPLMKAYGGGTTMFRNATTIFS